MRVPDSLIGAALAVGYTALLLGTADDLAMSRDESFYVSAAESYARWFRLLADDPLSAVQPAQIDAAWSDNHEHPPLMKSLFAWSWMAQQRWHFFSSETAAHRFPAMLIAGLLLWLIYAFGRRAFDRRVGLFAALAFALLPRPFYHAHLNCFDVPIAFMVTLVTYCYFRSLQSSGWAIWTGVAFGLALATKHNAWMLPAVFFIHWSWVRLAERARAWRGIDLDGAPPILKPWWLLSMFSIGPLLFVGLWPWLWYSPLQRFAQYAGFHLHHDYYNMAYLGVNYFQPPFPIGYPFVMTALTIPVTTLALSLLGVALSARAVLAGQIDRQQTVILMFGSLLAPILLIAMPWTPIFGGTKHWFPAYPFLALFAGVGFARLASQLSSAWLRYSLRDVAPVMRPLWRGRAPLGAGLAVAGCGAVLLSPAVVETAHSHRFGLSHYGVLAGGVPGSASLGMNRQFWGFTTGSLVTWLKQQLPQGGRVYICDTAPVAWDMLQRDGKLPRNITVSSLEDADYALVHHEHHFVEVDYQAWMAFGSVQPVHVLTYDGVPIISVYESPRHRQARQIEEGRLTGRIISEPTLPEATPARRTP